MAQGKRVDRVAEVIRNVLAEAILTEMKDPRLGFVTVTGVDVAPDLRDAKVYVSVLGDEKAKKSTIIAFHRAKGFLQFKINEALQIKFTPRLHFKLDESIERGMEIDSILNLIHKEEDDSKVDDSSAE